MEHVTSTVCVQRCEIFTIDTDDLLGSRDNPQLLYRWGTSPSDASTLHTRVTEEAFELGTGLVVRPGGDQRGSCA